MSQDNNTNVIDETADAVESAESKQSEAAQTDVSKQSEESWHAEFDDAEQPESDVTQEEIEETAIAVKNEQRKRESARPLKFVLIFSIVVILVLMTILFGLILLENPNNVWTVSKITTDSLKILKICV